MVEAYGEKDGTYIVAGVIIGVGKWYLRYFRCGVVSFDFSFSEGVGWVICMGQSVRGVCSRAYILKRFQIFYLAGCFVMANFSWSVLWLLIFRRVFCDGYFFVEAKEAFFDVLL